MNSAGSCIDIYGYAIDDLCTTFRQAIRQGDTQGALNIATILMEDNLIQVMIEELQTEVFYNGSAFLDIKFGSEITNLSVHDRDRLLSVIRQACLSFKHPLVHMAVFVSSIYYSLYINHPQKVLRAWLHYGLTSTDSLFKINEGARALCALIYKGDDEHVLKSLRNPGTEVLVSALSSEYAKVKNPWEKYAYMYMTLYLQVCCMVTVPSFIGTAITKTVTFPPIPQGLPLESYLPIIEAWFLNGMSPETSESQVISVITNHFYDNIKVDGPGFLNAEGSISWVHYIQSYHTRALSVDLLFGSLEIIYSHNPLPDNEKVSGGIGMIKFLCPELFSRIKYHGVPYVHNNRLVICIQSND